MPTTQDTIAAATLLRQAGRDAEALALFRRALARPAAARDSQLNLHAGDLLLAQQNAEQALFYLRRAAEADPANPLARAMIGNALLLQRKHEPAAAEYRAALAMNPEISGAWANLGACHYVLGRLGEAEDALRTAIAKGCPDKTATVTLAQLLGQMGRAEEAVKLLEPMVRAGASDIPTLGNFAYLSNCSSAFSAQAVTEAHRLLGGAIEAIVRSRGGPLPRAGAPRDAAGPIRVGFLSPDLWDHSVTAFLDAVLARRDAARTRVTFYSLQPREEDAVRRRLRSFADAWHDCERTPDAELAALIRRENIDVLIDLAGNTSGHRLALMAMRPARLHVTAIGYPATTGLSSIDLRLCDAITDPPGTEHLLAERPWRLDGCFLCYRPRPDAPAIAERPTGEAVSFGSFNNLSKLSDACVALWSRVLAAVPGSRLVLKSMMTRDPRVGEYARRRFAEAGLDVARLDILAPDEPRTAHLASYSAIDIALDTFPYNGTTTTCEALWMGVPVITFPGDRHAARVGASLLTAAGLPDLIAPDADGYVALAARLAADHRSRAALRASLRARVAASALCDAPAYAARFWSGLDAALETVRRR